MELQDAIQNRRTIRKFSDYYVTDNDIKKLLQAAQHAPSWANTQVWEFIVIRERELIKLVTETYSPTNPARDCSFSSSAIIVCCARSKESGYKKEEQRTKFPDWFMFDVGMSVQNICLTAHELGLGTVIVGSMDHDKCKELLLVPDGHEVVAAIPIGKPESIPEKIPKRKEFKEFVFLDKFGDHFAKIY